MFPSPEYFECQIINKPVENYNMKMNSDKTLILN